VKGLIERGSFFLRGNFNRQKFAAAKRQNTEIKLNIISRELNCESINKQTITVVFIVFGLSSQLKTFSVFSDLRVVGKGLKYS